MNAHDRQTLVERYLSGSMSSTEAGAFAARLETDPELRRLVDAERVIVDAVAHDVAMMPQAATVPSASLMASLEAARRVAPTGPAGSAWISTKVATIIGTIGVLGIIAGTVFVAPLLRDDTQSVTPRVGNDAATVAPVETLNAPAPNATPSAPTPSTIAVAPHSDAPRSATTHERAPRTATTPMPRSGVHATPPATTSTRDDESTANLPSQDDPNVKVDVQIESGKK
jgi:hypothetical protein